MRANGFFLLGLVLLGTGTGCKNLHRIDGDWWRSAQPKPEWLHDFVKEKEIKVILNLRGAHPGDRDYDREVATAGALGVPVVGIAMSPSRPMERETLLLLLDFLEDHGGESVLVHCKAGSDRSGLVAFLYLVEVRGWDHRRARRKALSVRYGHFRCPLNPWATPEMDRFAEGWKSAAWAREHYGLKPRE